MTNNDDKLKMVGKRMPYTMPNGLFERMQSKVMGRMVEIDKERQARKRRDTLILRLSVAVTAIAASVCIVVLLRFGNGNDNGGYGTRQTANSASVEKAYENLSQEDQKNLLADYKNDIYMSLQ